MSQWNVYVGAYTKEFAAEVQRISQTANIFWKGKYPGFEATPSEGIERLIFDDATGEIRHLGNAASGVVNPQYVTLHPTKPVLYAAEWDRPGKLTSYQIAADGTLERRASIETHGDHAVAVCVHPSGKAAYVAHWGDGSVTVCTLDDAGHPITAERIARKEPIDNVESHLHQVVVSPSGSCLIWTDLGFDEISTIEVDADGRVNPDSLVRIPFPAHSSPRHVEFHPSGKTVYVNGEHDSKVYVLDAEDGLPTRIRASLRCPPPEHEGTNSCSELSLHPDAHALYVGNRGADCVTVFTVGANGDLSIAGYQPSLGRSPRAVRVEPSGKFLVVGNRNTNGVVVFKIGPDHLLETVGSPAEVPAPSSIVFVPVGT
jgi:6-phosphogluconolactonase